MFNGKVEWRFWFIHLCRTMAFEYFVVFNRTVFTVNCLRKGIKHSASRGLVQAVTDFGCSLSFPHKEFNASFRIILRMKCRPTEGVGIYFWLETKMQGEQPLGNMLQSRLFLVTKLTFGETLQATSVFLTSRVACGWWPLPYSTTSAFIMILKHLKQCSLYKFTVKPFGLRCRWMLSWKYV